MNFDKSTLRSLHQYLQKQGWVSTQKDALIVYQREYYSVKRKIILPSESVEITNRELTQDINQALNLLENLYEVSTEALLDSIANRIKPQLELRIEGDNFLKPFALQGCVEQLVDFLGHSISHVNNPRPIVLSHGRSSVIDEFRIPVPVAGSFKLLVEMEACPNDLNIKKSLSYKAYDVLKRTSNMLRDLSSSEEDNFAPLIESHYMNDWLDVGSLKVLSELSSNKALENRKMSFSFSLYNGELLDNENSQVFQPVKNIFFDAEFRDKVEDAHRFIKRSYGSKGKYALYGKIVDYSNRDGIFRFESHRPYHNNARMIDFTRENEEDKAFALWAVNHREDVYMLCSVSEGNKVKFAEKIDYIGSHKVEIEYPNIKEEEKDVIFTYFV